MFYLKSVEYMPRTQFEMKYQSISVTLYPLHLTKPSPVKSQLNRAWNISL